MPSASLRYLLLQVRNSDDPMRAHEVESFARVLCCPVERIEVFDLLAGAPSTQRLESADMLLLGGSGHYSATAEEPWLYQALETLRDIHDRSRPTFASCWGFQAMARAMGGSVVNDPQHAELGTHVLRLSDVGRDDPVFGPVGDPFNGQMGHEDTVDRLPPDAELLASSGLVENQAFRFAGRPIYCTQFHAELDRAGLLRRVRAYPEYIEKVSGMTLQQFEDSCEDTPETEELPRRFVRVFFE